MRSLKIVNVKFSLKLNNIMYQDVVESTKTMIIKEKSNFIVVFGKYTYTIFKKSKSTSNLHCNVTKVPDLENISHAIDYLHNFLHGINISNLSVDNITSTTSLNEKISLEKLFEKLSPIYPVKYQLQKFPALFVKYASNNDRITIFFFSSGKINCVGCKNSVHVKRVSDWLDSLTI